MYQLKMGIPVKAIQFKGLNAIELFYLIKDASWLHMTPNQSLKLYYKISGHNFGDVELGVGDWLVVDAAGPIAVSDEHFQLRYEKIENTQAVPERKDYR